MINIITLIIFLIILFLNIRLNRSKEDIITRAKVLNSEITNSKKKRRFLVISLLIIGFGFGLLAYSCWRDFEFARNFMSQYEIGFSDLIKNYNLEKLVGDNISYSSYEMWALKRLEFARKMGIFLFLVLLILPILYDSLRIRITRRGIRTIKGLEPWSNIKNYYIDVNGDFNFIGFDDKLVYKLSIDKKDYFKLKDFLGGVIGGGMNIDN